MNYIVAPGVKGKAILKRGPELTQYIIDATCSYYGFPERVIKSVTRKREIVESRQVCMYLLRKCTGLHVAVIGKIFNCDHTTVVHSTQKIEGLIDIHDEKILEAIKTIKERI
jgi:chromosomal replication initiation ATPase DnaA